MPKEFTLQNVKFDNTLFLNISKLFSGYFGTCVLYSGGKYESSSCSYLCLFPYEFLWVHDKKLGIESAIIEKRHLAKIVDPWEALCQAMTYDATDSNFPEWVGYFSYELGMYSDKDKLMKPMNSEWPLAYFLRSSLILAVDHKSGQGKVRIKEHAEYLINEEEKEWVQRLSMESKWEELIEHLRCIEEDLPACSPLDLGQPLETCEEYQQKIAKVQELIHSGDIYQVNLSHRLNFKGSREPFSVFQRLSGINPAPFSAFINLNKFSIVSSSPERFLSKRQGWLETRPIKGTIPRGKNNEEDRKNLETLLNSAKENAELLMITDLMRHDLGKISTPGSVTTPQIRTWEAYENVYHLLSIVKSQAQPEIHSINLIRSCFPGGSITGCPKLNAMEVIAELEKRPREIYTGSIGYLACNGDFDFNIAIRTIIIAEKRIDVQLGGAIVADSDPEKEYQETFHKGASIFKALQLDEKIFFKNSTPKYSPYTYGKDSK